MFDRIDGRYVHKRDPRNVLLGNLRRHETDAECYIADMAQDIHHPFFFEHPLDHIPAMMMVEAGRQLGIAISHIYLGVPLDRMFATRSFDIHFSDFAELTAPIQILARVTDRTYRRDELLYLRLDGTFFQNEQDIGGMGGTWSMLKPEVWRRYRRKEQGKVVTTVP